MKMRTVTHNQFWHILEITDAKLEGKDIGSTHGIITYTRQGKIVGVSSWYKDSDEKIWTHQVANYLAEAYLK